MGKALALKLNSYLKVIREFVENDGKFVLLTRDKNFIKLIETLVIKELAIKKRCIYIFFKKKDVIEHLKAYGTKTILFVERVFDGESTAEFIQDLKNSFNNVYIILLTSEVEREMLVNFYEAGVDNFITKPISLNSLIEKIYFTLKPPTKIKKLLEGAREYIKKGEYDKAIKVCEKVLSIKPNSPGAFLVMGDVYKAMGKVDEAVECYLKAHENADLYLEPLKRLASIFEELKDKRNQLKYLLKLDKLNPLNVDRKVEIGCIYSELGEREEAQKYFNQALRIVSKEAKDKVSNLAFHIAERLMKHDPKLAEEYYYKSLEVKGNLLDISDVEKINRLGICLRQQKRPKEAIREYKKALKVLPDNPGLLYNIAIAYLEAGEVDNAKVYLNRLFKVDPDFYKTNEVVCYNIGMLYYKNNEIDKAVKFMREALKINPYYSPAKKFLEKVKVNN